jgi:23S rRNA (guanine745-N1)-methyltransferase
VSPLPLACTVRGCHLPLERQAHAFTCSRGHTFDIARAGYLNLLQPQDRKSSVAGDPPPAVDARARLLDAGIGMHLLTSVAATPQAMALTPASVAVDLGCGTGHMLRLLNASSQAITIGVDLSTRAIELSARRAPGLMWVVANADRRLPLLDHRVDLVLSVHARRNPAEAARIAAPGAAMIVAVPADDDLVELREAVQGERSTRERVDQLIAEHRAEWRVADRWAVRETRRCSAGTLRDLLVCTYRGGRRSQAERIDALGDMDVTFASDIVVFLVKT